jgi:hypothetical protein
MPRLLVLTLAAVVLLAAAPAVGRADYSEEQLKADLKLFDDAKLPHDDADLIAFFRQRLVTDKDRERIEALIKKLASTSFKEREQARMDIEKEGPPALSLLRKVEQSNAELEVKQRAKKCVEAIEKKSSSALVMAGARILKHRRAKGSCEMLLEYVALAPDDNVEEEIFSCIYSLALAGAHLDVLPPKVKAGKLDPVVVKALTDKEPARRAIAALVVSRFGTAAERKAVAKLLTDENVAVRFRAAQGLATAQDKSGVPVLIELLDKGPMQLALQAEDLLSVMAEGKGPATPLSEKAEDRKKCGAEWKDWWDKNKETVDLTKVEIDAPFGGMTARASAGATAFVKALLSFDTKAVAKVTDVPFSLGGQLTFNTRDEFDAFINMIKNQPPPKDFKYKVRKVVSAAEYLKGAPEVERNFLEANRPSQVHVVYLDFQEGNQTRTENIPLFIRISGGRAKCIGFANPRGN